MAQDLGTSFLGSSPAGTVLYGTRPGDLISKLLPSWYCAVWHKTWQPHFQAPPQLVLCSMAQDLGTSFPGSSPAGTVQYGTKPGGFSPAGTVQYGTKPGAPPQLVLCRMAQKPWDKAGEEPGNWPVFSSVSMLSSLGVEHDEAGHYWTPRWTNYA